VPPARQEFAEVEVVSEQNPVLDSSFLQDVRILQMLQSLVVEMDRVVPNPPQVSDRPG